MSESEMVVSSKVVNEFMTERGWQGRSCSACGKTFFVKLSSKISASTCGWHGCDKGTYLFRSLTKRKSFLTPAQVKAKMSEYFSEAGFESVAPRNIASSEGKTDLVIAGVQMFDGAIHHGQDIPRGKMFVAQPCVRMQFQEHVSSQEGISTAFVNVCTEKMGARIDEHLQAIDGWMTILSKLGLHMNDFVVIMRTSVNNWGTGEFTALELFFSYGGLELGDASYALVPQKNHTPIALSDIGFGLERIVWAMNKTSSYFDTLVPWTLSGSKEMFDSCRTLALLSLCGVQAGNKGAGLQFRRFAKVLSEKYYGSEMYHALPYYFDYWEQFIKPTRSRDDAVQIVRLEIERLINLKISEMLRLPPPRDETTEAYLDRLVYTCNVNIHELRKAIQSCR